MTTPNATQTAARLARVRGRYRLKLTAGALLLVVVPLALVSWLALRTFRLSLEDQVKEQLYSSIDEVGQLVDRELISTQQHLEVLSDLLADAAIPAADRVMRARVALAGTSSIASVIIYDGTGQTVDVLRKPDDHAVYPSTAPAEFRSTGATPNRGQIVGAPAVTNDGPRLPLAWSFIVDAASQERWTLVAQIRIDALANRLGELAERRFDGHPDALWVLTRDLRVVANADPEVLGSVADLASTPLFQGEAKAAIAVLASGGESMQTLSVTEYQGPRGAMVAGVRTLQAAPLVLVAQLSRNHAFAPVTRMRNAVIAVVAVAAVLSMLVGFLLARRMSAPVGLLVGFADQLAARNFAATVDVRTGDELEVLGSALRDAANGIVAGERRILDEQQIRGDLGRYLPRQLVDRVVARQHELQLGGVRQNVTVLFADVAAFTALVEQHPPEVVVGVLNQLFTLLTELIFRHGGTVDKFMGDCVMAFWNAPDPQDDHVERAVRCAQDMLRWLESGNAVWEVAHGLTVHLAIGVHTGEAVVGNFGSQTRMEYTCVGDTVNVAARLEHLARPQQILTSAQVRAAAPHVAEYIDLGKTSVPGRQQPIEVVEVD